MTASFFLWLYIILLLVGGFTGWYKAKSTASLVASSLFAAILVLFALNIFPIAYHWVVLLILLLFFGYRLAKSGKFMPNGLMLVLTALALVLPRFF